MAINSIENAVRYSTELDKMFAQKSATGFFADNALATKFVGAKTVIIPDVDFQGLADYDRDAGYTKGAITVSNTSYTMAMDRARSLQIDREDMDETGIANLAGKILGEYVRTKVVPECDAYVLSKLGGLALSRSNVVNGDVAKPYEALCQLINEVQSVVGYDEELVAFVDGYMFAALQNSAEISKMITVSDFKQGDVNLKVKSINGVSIIPVVSERMKTAYTFNGGNLGGFKPLSNAREIYMLVLPKTAAHLVKKTENMRIFTPEQNIDADAYKFDYRIYYDVFVNKSGLDAVWGWVSPTVNITAQPESITVDEGNISESLTVTATSEGTLTYQWYKCKDENKSGAVKVAGANTATLNIPEELENGQHYFFVKIIVDGAAASESEAAVVTVA
ncbi:MAG: immunoglobulin domain-containing protein [Ruminococcaceae bacterium]|nr:immunoglobulin domain-containing protein [Oscillospiraceae bacterium]